MRTSDSVENLQKAMVKIALELQNVQKSKKGYGYNYAPLDAVIEMLRAVLPKNGIWFSQFPTTADGKYSLITRVFHESGEFIEEAVEMPETELSGKANDTQKMGASITYMRRYALTAIFGIAADEDTDGVVPVKAPTKKAPAEKAPTEKAPAGKLDINPEAIVRADIARSFASGVSKKAIEEGYAQYLDGQVVDLDDLQMSQILKIARGLWMKRRRQNAVLAAQKD